MDPVTQAEIRRSRQRLTTPRAAAMAGILFSVLLVTSLLLIHFNLPTSSSDAIGLQSTWKTIDLALNLVPFAGIAFLWFIAVIRDRLGESEDQFFATVFLGSGFLFLAMLFATAAVAGGIISAYAQGAAGIMDPGLYAFGRAVTFEALNTYTMKMAGVFMISTCTLALRTAFLPRWMAFLGMALAVIMIFSLGRIYWALLLFPLWVLLISVYILIEAYRRPIRGDSRLQPDEESSKKT